MRAACPVLESTSRQGQAAQPMMPTRPDASALDSRESKDYAQGHDGSYSEDRQQSQQRKSCG